MMQSNHPDPATSTAPANATRSAGGGGNTEAATTTGPAAQASGGQGLGAAAYRGLWAVLAHLFRVPRTPPTIPRHGDGPVEAFRPSPRFLSYLRFWFWIALLLVDVAIVFAWILILIDEPFVAAILALPAFLLAVVPDIIAWVAIQLRYDTTWYILTDRSVRIRRGAIVIHETTITFENVQNVKVEQGPVQRHFGLSTIIIETAGSGGGGGGGAHGGKQSPLMAMNVGRIEGVEDAERLRDIIMNRLRASRGAGLGDESGRSGSSRASAPATIAAATSGTPGAFGRPATGAGGWTREQVDTLREIRDLLREERRLRGDATLG